MKRFLGRLWCRFTGHRSPLEVEIGRDLPFTAFRCPRCRATWFIEYGSVTESS